MEEEQKSGDSPNSSCAMSLGDFSMASLGEFVVCAVLFDLDVVVKYLYLMLLTN